MIHDLKFTAVGKEIMFKADLDSAVITENSLLYFIERKTVPEPEVVAVMARALRPGDIAIDCGANIGFFTLLMSRLVGPSGWVHAFEPWDTHVRKLNQHIELNGLTNVSVYAKALWSRQEKHLFRQEIDTGENKIALFGNEGCSTVWATTLDHELPHGIAPRLIKLDIEGSEQHALEGATKLLDNHPPPYIIAELNEPALALLRSSQDSLRAHLRNWGYETFLLHPNCSVPALLPAKTVLKPHRSNINLLYCSIDHFAELWPEVGT